MRWLRRRRFDFYFFFEDFFFEDFFFEEDFFFRGTLPPAFRASDSPIAIACFLLVTFFPEPLFKVPFLRSCIAFSTFSDAFFPYFAMLLLHRFVFQALLDQNPVFSICERFSVGAA
jgi:hypothetical protein